MVLRISSVEPRAALVGLADRIEVISEFVVMKSVQSAAYILPTRRSAFSCLIAYNASMPTPPVPCHSFRRPDASSEEDSVSCSIRDSSVSDDSVGSLDQGNLSGVGGDDCSSQASDSKVPAFFILRQRRPLTHRQIWLCSARCFTQRQTDTSVKNRIGQKQNGQPFSLRPRPFHLRLARISR